MLTDDQRIARYIVQTGRTTGDPVMRLTPRQLRRVVHKFGHQLDEAVEQRAKRSAVRAAARAAVEQRRAAFLPKPTR